MIGQERVALSTMNAKRKNRSARLILGLVLLIGFGVRLLYLLHSHPFFDEFTTVLAAEAILKHGWPQLPSGLFYEHGLLFSYLDTPFVALGLALGGPASTNWLFVAARLPSLLAGLASIVLLYEVGRRWFSVRAGLLAAALLAVSPEGMVWAGRARMYALAQLLAVALAYLVYAGFLGRGRSGLRWLAVGLVGLALLNQFGALMLIPPLVAAGLLLAWLTRPKGQAPCFWRLEALWQAVALAAVVVLAVLVKRLGQPLGAAQLGSQGSESLLLALWRTISYQAGLALNPADALTFLARQFGVPHHLWLSLLVLAGGLLALTGWLVARRRTIKSSDRPYRHLYLWLITGLPIVEMITLLEPWRRNPRYLVMILPWFYLLAAAGFELIVSRVLPSGSGRQRRLPALVRTGLLAVLAALAGAQLYGTWRDGRIAYVTPEPPYDLAFQYVAQQRAPGEVVLTMNTSAAALYLDRVDYFAIQDDADQFLLDTPRGPVDRWLGAPWLGTLPQLAQVLNDSPGAWFVIDTIRLPVYYRADWLAAVDTQMELVWVDDEALVYHTRADREPLATAPTTETSVRLGGAITLLGYAGPRVQSQPGGAPAVTLTLFWQTDAPLDADYTVFVHIRNTAGETIAQGDSQPVGGAYPTSRWLPGETVIDPHRIELPADLTPGIYSLFIGLYRVDTLQRLAVAGDTTGENAVPVGGLVLP